MNENPTIKPQTLPPLTKFIYTLGALPTSYLMSMTYEEQLVWLCNYLGKEVIPAINTNGEAVEELQQLYEDLQNYVNNYFDNLDIQTEVDNKIDAMYEAGTLQEIITEYLQINGVLAFDNVASMKSSTNLINGSTVRTTGYYNVNDGGGSLYKIRTITNDDIVDEAFIIEMSDNSLVAELLINNNTIDIRQIGGRCQDKENHKYDIKSYLEKYQNYLLNNPNRLKLYIPSGIWYCSPTNLTKSLDICGEFGYYSLTMTGTVITTLNDNQPYLLKLGSNTTGDYLKSWNLENIIFSSYDYTYRSENKDFYRSTPKSVSGSLVEMLYCIHGKMDNILFINVIGQPLKISSCWENIFPYLVFRYVSNPLGSLLCFDKDKTYGAGSNISSNDFQRLYFESTHGDLIEFKAQCDFGNNHIGTINFEPNEYNYNEQFTYENIDSGNIPEGLIHYSIIKLSESGSNLSGTKIDNIELNGYAYKIINYNSNKYTYDTIISSGSGNIYLGLTIDSINSTGTNKDIVIYKNNSGNTNDLRSYLIINNVAMYSNYNFIFDLAGAFSTIICNGSLYGGNKLVTKMDKNITPFHEAISKVQANTLFSDSEALNSLKLCVTPLRYTGTLWNGNFVCTGTKLMVRAKIPDTSTYVFRLRNTNGNTKNSSMVGTGNFEWYEIDLGENFNTFGQTLDFKSDAGSNPSGVLLDCYMFKD